MSTAIGQLVILRARFGDLPEDLSAQLEAVGELSRLTALQERAATVPSMGTFLEARKEQQETPARSE
ncbi:MAG TPA: hypothetical protein VHB98_13475 [Chloroflexota bacterium]|jgi:hypothetical protein|nr:hypothetical protein [Chloroflexota bacterium]